MNTNNTKTSKLDPEEMTPASIVSGELSTLLHRYKRENNYHSSTVVMELSVMEEGWVDVRFNAPEWFRKTTTAFHNTDLAIAIGLCEVVSHDPDGTRDGYFNIMTDTEQLYDLAIEIADLLTDNFDSHSEYTEATWGEGETHQASFTIRNGKVNWKIWTE